MVRQEESNMENGMEAYKYRDLYSFWVNHGKPDHRVSLDDLIKAANFDTVIHRGNFDMFERSFHKEGWVQYVGVIDELDRYKENPYRAKHMNRRDWQFADLEQLLAFAAQHPDVQRTINVIALGSEKRTDYPGDYTYLWNPHIGWDESEGRRLSCYKSSCGYMRGVEGRHFLMVREANGIFH